MHVLEPYKHNCSTYNSPMLGAPTLPSWPQGLCGSPIQIPSTGPQCPTPFSFKRSSETKPLIFPKGVFAPYNAHATLHVEASFWALVLPVTGVSLPYGTATLHSGCSGMWVSR